MHRALAAWLTARPWRAAFASALCGALSALFAFPFVVVVGAISALALLRFDAKVAFGIALAGATAATIVLLSGIQASLWVVVQLSLALCVFFGAPTLAVVLKRTGSMNFCVQVAVLAAASVVLLSHLLLGDPAAFWLPLVRPVVESMVAADLYPDAERNQLVHMSTQVMWGMLAALSLVFVLGALFLGRWWHSLLNAPGGFGHEYRQLRLGVVLGTLLTVVFALLFWSSSMLVGSLAWVGLVALVLQGLAAAHRSKAMGSLNQGWLAAIYVLLIVPLSNGLTIFALAVWGFIDNWRKSKVQSV